MKNTCFIILTVLGLLFSKGLSAQSLNCRVIESVGNHPDINPILLDKIRNQSVGMSFKGLTNLKKIVIKDIERLRFEGCKAIAIARVVVDRKVRKNAKGTILVKGDVVKAENLLGKSGKSLVCITNATIKDVDVSNTFRLGEKFYKWVGNKVFPDNHCYEW